MKPFDFAPIDFWLSPPKPPKGTQPRAVKDRCFGPSWAKKRAAVERVMDGAGVSITCAYLAARLGINERTARRHLLTGVDLKCFEMIKPSSWPADPAIFKRKTE